jgi:SAM-dependent methyltransferase
MSDEFYRKHMMEPDVPLQTMLDKYVSEKEAREDEAVGQANILVSEMEDINIHEHTSRYDTLIIGSGVGYIYEEFKNWVTPIGIDVSARKLDLSRSIFSDQNTYNLSAEDMEYNAQFDIIYVRNAFMWTDRPLVFLGKCIKAVKRHGIIILQCEDFNPLKPRALFRTKWDTKAIETICRAFPIWLTNHQDNNIWTIERRHLG